MFATNYIKSFNERIRSSIFSLLYRLHHVKAHSAAAQRADNTDQMREQHYVTSVNVSLIPF